MTCEDYRKLMMGLIDNELAPAARKRLENHLKVCPECRKELERFRILKDLADEMAMRAPEDRFWDGYWAGIYNRLERGFGWFLLWAGGLILLSVAVVWGVNDFLRNPDIPLSVRIGASVLGAGIAVLLVSVFRERFRAYKHERYKNIRR